MGSRWIWKMTSQNNNCLSCLLLFQLIILLNFLLQLVSWIWFALTKYSHLKASILLAYLLFWTSAAKMIPLFNLFAGGPLGSGKQWYCTQFLSPIQSYQLPFNTFYCLCVIWLVFVRINWIFCHLQNQEIYFQNANKTLSKCHVYLFIFLTSEIRNQLDKLKYFWGLIESWF